MHFQIDPSTVPCFFSLKTLPCLCERAGLPATVVFVFIVSNIDSDITNKISNEIKGVVSENISAENVRDIFHEISYVFSQKQENDVLETKQNENSEVLPSEEEFRIDENILEQMNDEKK